MTVAQPEDAGEIRGAVELSEGLVNPAAFGRLPWSLAGRRLPKFYLVSFWIDDPAKLSVLGIVDLLENVAPFFA